MELRHLRYYLALAEELHFGRAAKRLHISQPPLSVTVRQLEDELGLQLLERNSHVVRLTPAGENFAASARQLLADAELAARRARDLASGVTSRVRIGFVGSMMFRGLPEGLRRFRQSHPAVQTELTELNSTDQLDALLRGQIDLGFVHTQRVPKGLSTCLYMSERFMLCVPQDGQRWRWPPPPAVANQALVLFSRGASPDYHERVLQLCESLRLQPMGRHEVRHWLSVQVLVSKGLGYALVPEALRRSGLQGVRFVGLPPTDIRSEVHMVWNERRVGPALGALIGALRPQPHVPA